ncbi:Protein CBG15035 [Caenorhabditis briggsae]|uniref:Protein CBG15035 n=1 Tax=Caenorhabditis briggsae TaxID=6238 RepID=A8XL90_CAEBR|nr:Protein CBG15035 [Caenorhabditis briggsae]CAP33415.2 Protein CBG15035 [Caenorhabditis briggsae]
MQLRALAKEIVEMEDYDDQFKVFNFRIHVVTDMIHETACKAMPEGLYHVKWTDDNQEEKKKNVSNVRSSPMCLEMQKEDYQANEGIQLN